MADHIACEDVDCVVDPSHQHNKHYNKQTHNVEDREWLGTDLGEVEDPEHHIPGMATVEIVPGFSVRHHQTW